MYETCAELAIDVCLTAGIWGYTPVAPYSKSRNTNTDKTDNRTVDNVESNTEEGSMESLCPLA